MAITYTSVPGPMGSGASAATGPEAWGTYGVEIIKVVIDATAATSLVLSPRWLRWIDWADQGPATNAVIDNTVSPPTATMTIPSTANSTLFFKVGGRPR